MQGASPDGQECPTMAFGQQAGPPASARQVRELLAALKEAGHCDFRDARGPMGFTQRQAGGKFTRDEAAAFIEQLVETESHGSPPAAVYAGQQTPTERLVGRVSSEDLAGELRRRGWTVIEP